MSLVYSKIKEKNLNFLRNDGPKSKENFAPFGVIGVHLVALEKWILYVLVDFSAPVKVGNHEWIPHLSLVESSHLNLEYPNFIFGSRETYVIISV